MVNVRVAKINAGIRHSPRGKIRWHNFAASLVFEFVLGAILVFILLAAANAVRAEGTLSVAQLQSDFSLLRHSLEEAHPGLYRYTSKAEFDRRFAATGAKLNHTLTPLEFYRQLLPLIAAIKCGHTQLLLPETAQVALQTRTPLLPMTLEVIGRRVYILLDYSNEGVAGSEIVRINGRSVKRLLTQMMRSTSGDGDSETGRTWHLGHEGAFRDNIYTLFGLQGPFELVLRTPAGARRSLTIKGKTRVELDALEHQLHPQDIEQKDFAAWELRDADAVGILTIRAFTPYVDMNPETETGTLPMGDFLNHVFAELADRSTRALIIDLRGNPGGLDELGLQLFSYLIDRPFRYYDDLIVRTLTISFAKYASNPTPVPIEEIARGDDGFYHWIKHPNIGIHPPRQPHFDGRVIVLMNGGSFSTAGEFLSMLRYSTNASFLGEETGAGYLGNNSGFGTRLTLPASKLVLRIPMCAYNLAIHDQRPSRRGVMPDVSPSVPISERLAGRDIVMAEALKMARQ